MESTNKTDFNNSSNYHLDDCLSYSLLLINKLQMLMLDWIFQFGD